MSPLPDDIAKIRDELAEEHKLLTKDNGIESSNYHFKAGFNACAEIFLKREALIIIDDKNAFIRVGNNAISERNKLQARNEKLVEAMQLSIDTVDETRKHMILVRALAATAQAPKEK